MSGLTPYTLAQALFAAAALAVSSAPTRARASACVLEADLDGIVTTGTAEYVHEALRQTEARGCVALLLVMDTPGGGLEPTRVIVRALLGASVPVVSYVAPAGARAGSAGMFIALAAHVAAMAPGTVIGAAHPVRGNGENIGAEGDAGASDLARKIENDTAALARAIAAERGRNGAWMEDAVRKSVSLTDREAKQQGVINFIVDSPRDLLVAIDGQALRLAGDRKVVLATRDASIEPVRATLRQQALAVLGNPNLAYLLLMLGIMGLLIELSSPGLVAPGVVGGVALLFAALGLDLLPVNIGALLLIVLAAGLFVAELYVTAHGLLAVGGLVCLLVGSSLLVDSASPDIYSDVPLRVSWGAIVPLSVVIAVALGAFIQVLRRTRARRSPSGEEGLIGELALVLEAVGPGGGYVRVHGERWRAVSDSSLALGETACIVAVDGLTLRVALAPRAPASSPITPSGRNSP